MNNFNLFLVFIFVIQFFIDTGAYNMYYIICKYIIIYYFHKSISNKKYLFVSCNFFIINKSTSNNFNFFCVRSVINYLYVQNKISPSINIVQKQISDEYGGICEITIANLEDAKHEKITFNKTISIQSLFRIYNHIKAYFN